jgi:tetratricopeptide (TPR) repeat protein
MRILNCLLIIYSLTFNYVEAQSSEECLNNLSIFAESAKIKNYDTAYETWLLVLNECPKLNLAIYSYGERILKHKIKNSSGEDQQSYKNDLISLYDKWIINFPNRKGVSKIGNILSTKAQALIDYKMADDATVYGVFDEAYKKDPSSFTNPKGLYNYFDTLYKQYKSPNTTVSTEHLFNMYEEISEKFEFESTSLARKLDKILIKEDNGNPLTKREIKNKRVYDVNSRAIGIFLSNLDAIVAIEATCENLIPLYQKNFEENKTDPIWLKRAASRMDSKECSDDPLFVTLVEALHTLDPSADSAYYLGLLNDKKGKSTEALKYYEESILLESDQYKKAKILYKIAVKFKNSGRKQSSRRYAQKALRNQPSMGRAHLLIASLYASSANDCGENQFNKRAIYWLAADLARKAGRVDASIKKLATRTAQSYMGRAPSKTDIFSEANEGSKIKFNCWVGASVTVPKL